MLNAAIRQLANIYFTTLTNTNYYDIAWWKIVSQGKMDKKTRLGQKKFNKVWLKSYAKFKIFKKWQKIFYFSFLMVNSNIRLWWLISLLCPLPILMWLTDKIKKG